MYLIAAYEYKRKHIEGAFQISFHNFLLWIQLFTRSKLWRSGKFTLSANTGLKPCDS
jgi:hypothetical protein